MVQLLLFSCLLLPANEVWGKVIFSEACVKNSVQVLRSGPGTPPGTRYTPWDQVHPPGPGTCPWDQVHPPGPGTPPWEQVHPPGPGTPPWDQVHHPPRTRYMPPGAVHARRYRQQAGGTHPTGMHSCYNINPRSEWCL